MQGLVFQTDSAKQRQLKSRTVEVDPEIQSEYIDFNPLSSADRYAEQSVKSQLIAAAAFRLLNQFRAPVLADGMRRQFDRKFWHIADNIRNERVAVRPRPGIVRFAVRICCGKLLNLRNGFFGFLAAQFLNQLRFGAVPETVGNILTDVDGGSLPAQIPADDLISGI